MLKENITHKSTLKAISKHNITDEMLLGIPDHETLKLVILRASRRYWARNHKQYIKEKYINEYRDKYNNRKYLKELPCI